MKRNMAAIIIAALCLLFPTTQTLAQRKKPRAEKPKPVATTKPALAVVNNPAPSYSSGEINIVVRGDENPIIRLQMVANGQALVEFPAKDRIFKVNPADPDLVTIEDSPTKENDRYILLRSSRQFLPQAPGFQGSSAATSMLVQMTSGMVVTLLVYPVRDLEQVVHRCVVRYDREAIIKARQAAGLAVNLDQQVDTEKPKAAISSFQFTQPFRPAPASASFFPVQTTPNPCPTPPPPTLTTKAANDSSEARAPAQTPSVSSTEIKAPKEPKESHGRWENVGSGKMNWSKAQHGLKAAAQTRALDAKRRLVAVSVRNTLSLPIKIAPNQPELSVQTLDDRERVLQVEPVKPLKIETTHSDGLLAPGEIARYLILYEAPILGAKQRLCVAVAQINAADEPVMIELTSGTR
jgi:hypothetical protein